MDHSYFTLSIEANPISIVKLNQKIFSFYVNDIYNNINNLLDFGRRNV